MYVCMCEHDLGVNVCTYSTPDEYRDEHLFNMYMQVNVYYNIILMYVSNIYK